MPVRDWLKPIAAAEQLGRLMLASRALAARLAGDRNQQQLTGTISCGEWDFDRPDR